jgi:dolichol-phosphate mannosyltransferase
MPEELMAPPAAPPAPRPTPLPVHTRVRHGLKRPHNWIQLMKFFLVGGSGYVVNLAVFWFCHIPLGIHHIVSATIAFLVAVFNNFWWNRHWTFGAREGHAGFQAARFFTVSVVAFFFALGVLQLLVSAGLAALSAQAISIVAATPLNFVGNKMWSFGRSVPRASR